MTPNLAIALGSALLSLVATVLALRKHDIKKHEAAAAAKETQARRYAELGWAYARQQPDFGRPGAARRHAVSGFIIADTAVDGRRDFTDKQVAFYVDATKPDDLA